MIMFSAVQKLPVNSLREGYSAGQVEDVVVDPDNGRVLGFKLSGVEVKKRHILSVTDVRDVNPDMILIDDSQVLATEAEVIRIAEVLADRFKLVGLKVETDLGRKLGKVEDFAFDTRTFAITRVYATGGLIHETFASHDLIIPAQKIIEVTPKKLIVEDDYVKTESRKERLAQEPA